LDAKIKYPIISDIGDWYQVDVSGRIGYVYKPSTTRTFVPSDRFFQVTDDNIGIYDNSSGSLVQVGTLVKGQVYPRIADDGDWHQVKYGNGFGYVYKGSTSPVDSANIKNLNPGLSNRNQYFIPKAQLSVYDNSSGSLVPFASLKAGMKYPILNVDGDWYQIDVSGRIGYVYKPSTTRTFDPSDRFFQVTDDNVGIYDNSSGSLVQVGTLVKGQVYPRVADDGDWHQVKFGNGFGYVYKGSTSPVDSANIKNINPGLSNRNQYFIPKEQLSVFDNTSGSLVPFASLKAGMKYPIIGVDGDWYQIDVAGRIGYVYKGSVQDLTGPLNGRVIVLDAGHGGKDTGALGLFNLEKMLTLKTTLEVGAQLQAVGAKVIYTRDQDIYLTLDERTKISNLNKADAFICIHYNSSTSLSANGFETYYYTQAKDQQLATYLHQGVKDQITLNDRGIQFGDFYVLRNNNQPAVLLELGFISNPIEEGIISTTSYQKQAAQGILNGLTKYFNR
jgi:N-acetylmuramoyl-L-alanine amidase